MRLLNCFWKNLLIAIVLVGIFGAFIVECVPIHQPDIEQIAHVASPSGKWSAQVVMVIYGDHWFVNEARYEVRISSTDYSSDVVVYSTFASGMTELKVIWNNDDSLIVLDTPDALSASVRQPHSFVRVAYQSNQSSQRGQLHGF